WHIAVKDIESNQPPKILATMKFGMYANSIDWSADDGLIYYAQSFTNKLKVVDPAGGEPVTLLGDVITAALSPDGGTLVYVGPDGLMISSPPGNTPRRYQPFPDDEIEIRWLPAYLKFSQEGDQIAYGNFRMDLDWFFSGPTDSLGGVMLPPGGSDKESGSLWIFPWPDGDGAEPFRPFDISPQLNDQPPTFSWLPGGRALLLSQFTSSLEGGFIQGDIRTGILSTVYPSSDALTYPYVSGDGQQILYTSESIDFNVVEIPLDGSPPRPVLNRTLREYSPSWSPDGSMSYFTDHEGRAEIRYRDRDRVERPLVNQQRFPIDQQPALLWPPGRLSPDGRLIAFKASTPRAPFSAYIAKVDGDEPPTPLLPSGWLCEYLSWSPGSDSLACSVTTPDGQFKVVVVSISDPLTVEVIHHERIMMPEWSPDGSRIAGIVPYQPYGILLLSRNGNPPDMVPFVSYSHQIIMWSQDSTRLYHTVTDGFPGLYEVDLESGEQTRILEFTPSFTIANPIINVMFGSLSPDGLSFVTTSQTYQAGIHKLEISGRQRRWW
ncbi:hypothetical protein ACFL39_02100, partial [Gemmatimonadota bacterium]